MAGEVVRSKWLFDPTTTPSLRAIPPVPGGELLLVLFQFLLLQFIRTRTVGHQNITRIDGCTIRMAFALTGSPYCELVTNVFHLGNVG